jgi:type I restriction enzyme S subunit
VSQTFAALADLGVAVLDCEHRTPPAQDEGYPYIAIPDIHDGRVDLATSRRISRSDLDSWTRRSKPAAGDIVVTRRGRVGDTAPIPDGVECAIGQNLVLLRSDGSQIDQRYLRWATRGPAWRSEVERLTNVGAVFSSLNVRDIPQLRIPLFPMTTQQAIAEVLGALDDKIAQNSRTVGLLVELADARFAQAVSRAEPGPQTFGDVAHVGGGGTPRTTVDEYWGGEVYWATPTDVTALSAPYLAKTARTITDEGLAACSSALYPVGSILMTSRATIGKFALAQVPTAVNQGFIVVNAKNPAHQWWLFHEMKSRVSEFVSFSNGATFLELPRGRFKDLKVRLVAEETARGFGDLVGPLHATAAALVVESNALSKTRDDLLPLLMSGKVRVKDAEKQVEAVL